MTIDQFNGPYRFLSNFWPAVVKLDGLDYQAVEIAYVAAKTLDPVARTFIRGMRAGEAKRFGKGLVLRPDWEDAKLGIMRDLVTQKFRHRELGAQLLATWPRKLIEGNNWGDTYWGVCGGLGHNHLGKILMDVREGLRHE